MNNPYPYVTDTADGPVSPGTAATNSTLVGGVHNSTLPTLSTGQQAALQIDKSGALFITANYDNAYVGNTYGQLYATPTIVWTLYGSVTNVARPVKIGFTINNLGTGSGAVQANLVKYSSAASGGTDTNTTAIIPMLATSPTHSATFKAYGGSAPTPGTSLGAFRSDIIWCGAGPYGEAVTKIEYVFGEAAEEPPAISGTAQGIALVLNTTGLYNQGTFGPFYVTAYVTWTEV